MEMKNDEIKKQQEAMLKMKKVYKVYSRKMCLYLKKGKKERTNNNKRAIDNKVTKMGSNNSKKKTDATETEEKEDSKVEKDCNKKKKNDRKKYETIAFIEKITSKNMQIKKQNSPKRGH